LVGPLPQESLGHTRILRQNSFDSGVVLNNGIAKLNPRIMTRRLMLACLVASFAAALFCAQGQDKKKTTVDVSKLPPPSDRKDVTYAADIKPIFDSSCVKCHSGPKAKGKLHLDTLASALKGGDDGNEIVPGNSATSTLVINIAHLGEEEDYMPPPDNKLHIGPLTKEKIGLIRAWIDQGAK
jgi:hypothetical protein